MTEYILEMQNITKEFPGVIALKNVSFEVKQGRSLLWLGKMAPGNPP